MPRPVRLCGNDRGSARARPMTLPYVAGDLWKPKGITVIPDTQAGANDIHLRRAALRSQDADICVLTLRQLAHAHQFSVRLLQAQ